MDKLHKKLVSKYSWYAKWHQLPRCSFFHWLVFIGVAIFTFNNLSIGIKKDPAKIDVGIGYANLAQQAAVFKNRKTGEAQDHILLKFRDNLSKNEKAQLLSKYQLKESAEIKQIKVKIVSIPVSDTPQEVVDKLKHWEKKNIQFAETDTLLPPSLIPNDPQWPNQWDKQKMNTPAAWDSATGRDTITVAVADTGVDCNHEDLAANCVPGWNFYDNNSDTADVYGHGTAVAGTIAAAGNNNLGVAGLVWHSKIMPLRISDSSGYASFSAIAEAVIYAADRGVKVVNNSYQSGGSSTVGSAANYLKKKGGLLTVSEGNYGKDTGLSNNPDIISVSGTDTSDNIYSWSSYGNDVDVAAPGCSGLTTLKGGGYGGACGTSFSSPSAAGVLMLIFSANPNLTPDQAQGILFSSAKDLGLSGWDKFYGWGRIDAGAAVAMVLNGPTPIPTSTPTITPTPTPTQNPEQMTITSYSVSNKTATTAAIIWTTNINSSGCVSYGKLSGNLDMSVQDPAIGTSHSVTLAGLSSGTKYYYKIMAANTDGTSTVSSPVSNFKTLRR